MLDKSIIKWGRKAKVYTDEGICHLWTLVSSQNHRLYIFFLSSNLVSKVIHDVCILLANYQLNLFTRNIEQLLSMSFELPHYPNGLWCIFELVHILKMSGWGISLLCILRVIAGWSILKNYPTHIILYPTSASKRTHGNLSFLGCLEESIE